RRNSMQTKTSSCYFIAATVALLLAAASACNQTKNPNLASGSSVEGKIPITTKSEEAKHGLRQGRALAKNLLAQDSPTPSDRAIALDPEFAAAELARCNASPTAKEFFEHQERAVNLVEKTSEGERLLILANQAGANGEATKQREYLEKLVA